MADGQQVEQQAEQQPARPKRVPGRPFQKGVCPNPNGRAGNVEEPDPEGGVVNAGRMRKVLGQGKAADTGPTEKLLRKWLDKDTKGYIQALDQKARAEGDDAAAREETAALTAENARLRAELAALRDRGADAPDDDPGTDAALGRIEKLLAEAGADVGPDGRCRSCGQLVDPAAAGRR
jgi:hypothetical protein